MIGALVVAAIALVSVSAIVFQGRDGGTPTASHTTTTTLAARAASTTTSSTTTTSTTTTAPPPTTAPAPPPPTVAPTPVQAAPPAPAPAPTCDGGGSSVIDAMNGDRGSAGLGQLCASSALGGFAQSWADWMARNQSLTHQDLGAVLNGTTFATVAENILAGPGGMSAAQMEAAWMASPGHRENIMNGGYTAAGVGTAYSADGRVWVAVEFGG